MSVRRLLPVLLALVLGLLAAFAVACGDGGDEKLLGPNSADRIRTALEDIDRRVQRGECGDRLQEDLDSLSNAVQTLPESVDRQLKVRLGDGVRHLRDVAPRDCRENEPETVPETTPETVPETIPETVPETTPETVPETTPETTPTTPPETTPTPEPPPDEPVLPEDTGGTPGAGVAPGQAKKGDKG